MALFTSQFAEIFETRKKNHHERALILEKIKISLLRKIPFIKKTNTHQPIILGSSHTRMSILSLGYIPENDQIEFFNPKYIYPIGYICKRKYRKFGQIHKQEKNQLLMDNDVQKKVQYENVKNEKINCIDQSLDMKNSQNDIIQTVSKVESITIKDEKIFYFMKIDLNKKIIIECDEMKWEGSTAWKDFVESFENNNSVILSDQNDFQDTVEQQNDPNHNHIQNIHRKESEKYSFNSYTANYKLDGMNFEEFFGLSNPQLHKIIENKMYMKYKEGLEGYIGM